MKRYFKAFGYLLSVHVLALLVMTLFRLVEFIALHGMIVDAEASRVMAFVKGVWFDNVIACYISVLPVAVLLIAASLGWCHRRLLRGINIWYAAWFAIAFMPSAAPKTSRKPSSFTAIATKTETFSYSPPQLRRR